MRLRFATIMWLLLSDGSHAELPDSTAKSAGPVLAAAGATKGHLRVPEPTPNDDDERGLTTATVELIASASKPVFSHESIEKWTKDELSTDAVFKLLTLDKAGNNLLSHANFALLDNFARKQSQTSLIQTLTTQCGEDGLAKLIEAAKQVPQTARLAKRLQKEQFRYWVVQKKDPSDVFKMMKLDEAGDKIFEQPQVITWADFFDYFNRLDLKEGKSLLDYFEAYDVSLLVHMLIAAKAVPSTERLAVRLQADLTLRWLDERKTPKEVLGLLNLSKDSFFENPLFTAWLKYLDDFNTKLRKRKRITALATLQDTYGVDGLDEIVAKANASPSTERIATEWIHELQEIWLQKKLTPSDVSNQMELMEPAEGTLRKTTIDRALEGYTRYLKTANDVIFALKRHTDDSELMAMLIKAYMDPKTHRRSSEILHALLNQQASVWLLESNAPKDNFFKKLHHEYSKGKKARKRATEIERKREQVHESNIEIERKPKRKRNQESESKIESKRERKHESNIENKRARKQKGESESESEITRKRN